MSDLYSRESKVARVLGGSLTAYGLVCQFAKIETAGNGQYVGEMVPQFCSGSYVHIVERGTLFRA